MENDKATLITYADTLGEIAYMLNSADYILQDIQEKYFGAFDPKSDHGKFVLSQEFNRYRAKANAVSMIMGLIFNKLDEAGITAN